MSITSEPNTLWLYTSLSSGSSQIVTATSRLETILKANRIEFKAVDVATDDKARKLWGRRAGNRKLPGLVRDGLVLGDINEVEEWNEYGEIKEMLALEGAEPTPPANAPAPKLADSIASKPAEISTTGDKEATSDKNEKPQSPASSAINPMAASLQQLGFEAAEKAKELKSKLKPGSSTVTSTTNKAEQPPEEATTEAKEDLSKLDDSTAPDVPPPSGVVDAETATKAPETTSVESSTDEAVADAAAAPVTEPLTTSPAVPEPETGAATVASAVESTASLPVEESSDRTPAGDPETTQHRGSNLSAASAEEIAEVEEAATIDEHPDEEEEAAAGEPSAPSLISPGAAKQVLLPDDDDDLQSEAGRDAEPHIKFVGEAPGQEIDRVKATLGGKSAADVEKQAAAEPSEKAAPTTPLTAVDNASEEKTDDPSAEPTGNADVPIATGPSEDNTEPKPETATTTTTDGVSASAEGESLPGTTAHEQAAGDSTKVGDSVAD